MKQQPTRRRLPLVALATIWATFAPALLDAGEQTSGAAVEAGHDPATCAVLHDHAACNQLVTSAADVPPVSEEIHGPRRAEGSQVPVHAKTPPARTHDTAPAPRAPPIPLD